MKEVVLTTDGACSPNPGVGGWACILRHGTKAREMSGRVEGPTTNNRMEFQAVIEGLQALKEPCSVLVRSDSMVVVYLLRKGAKKAHKRANQDQVQTILGLTGIHRVRVEWIKGHAQDPDNIRCDKLATEQVRNGSAKGLNPARG